jgi:hypothetical protein
MEKYGVPVDWIVNYTMDMNEVNAKILMNEKPCGHAVELTMSLLNEDDSWLQQM